MTATPRRILIVAPGPAGDRSLLAAVAARARSAPTEFTLLVPAVARGLHQLVDPEDHCCAEAQAALDAAIPALSAAAGTKVSGRVASTTPSRRPGTPSTRALTTRSSSRPGPSAWRAGSTSICRTESPPSASP